MLLKKTASPNYFCIFRDFVVLICAWSLSCVHLTPWTGTLFSVDGSESTQLNRALVQMNTN